MVTIKGLEYTYTSAELREWCIAAIDGALVSRGKRKGLLKASCPDSRSDAAAAWQAMMGYANPYKMSISSILFFSDRQRCIYRAIDAALEGKDLSALDRDRLALEVLGVW
jgi:hypothetical protein